MKKIAVINDMSGFGRCSLTAALPVISSLGVQACPLPTAILSSQTAYPTYTCVDFTEHMGGICKEWQKLKTNFHGIYTGFVSCEEQIDEIFKFLEYFHHKDNFLLVDPIMGDDGKTYDIFTSKLLDKMIQLSTRADIITPNLTELCLIGDYNYDLISSITDKNTVLKSIASIGGKILKMGPKAIIVTGVHFLEDGVDMVANVLLTSDEIFHLAHPYLGGSYSGTGDLFASCMAGGLAKGISMKDTMAIGSEFLYEAIKEASNKNMSFIEGVPFENHLYKLMDNHK